MAMNITSEEVNFLVYRYLLESGFQHTAFSFFSESMVSRSDIDSSTIPHGSLISILQKGLQYTEIETHLQEDGSEVNCTEPFSLISRHVCQLRKKKDSSKSISNNSNHSIIHSQEGKVKKEKSTTTTTTTSSSANSSHSLYLSTSTSSADKDVKMTTDSDDEDSKTEVKKKQVLTLERHEKEVFVCLWNPTSSILASGGGDSKAIIWKIPPNEPANKVGSKVESIVLDHKATNTVEPNQLLLKSVDVTTLDWNSDGSLLATGSYDGVSRIWTAKGDLIYTLTSHSAPIFSLKWNKRGNYLLSGSVDKKSIVWDTTSGTIVQQFEYHQAATLDIDWRDNTQFATCSTDRMIYVCEIGKNQPVRAFDGHDDEINSIRWDPTGNLLASCSDDQTIKIWNMKTGEALKTMEHSREIYTIRWSPCGPGSKNPNKDLVLASGSFDTTIKIWNVETGSCLHQLKKHLDPVYTVSFSPNGEYLASGSFDKYLNIWSVKDGSLIKTYKGSGGIFEVCWNNIGDKVSACFSDSTVCVMDIRV